MHIEEISKDACVTPILSVIDLQASFDYYVNRLKFVKAWEWGEPAEFGAIYFGNKVELFLREGTPGNSGSWMSIFIKNVDDYAHIVENAGADIVYGPVDEPWGMREIHVKDPDGNIIRFSTALEHAPDPVRPSAGS